MLQFFSKGTGLATPTRIDWYKEEEWGLYSGDLPPEFLNHSGCQALHSQVNSFQEWEVSKAISVTREKCCDLVSSW